MKEYRTATSYSAPGGDVRSTLQLTPAGMAIGDLVSIVAYTFVGSVALALVVVLAEVVILEWPFARAWRWGVGAGLVPPAIVGLTLLRLLVALVNAALERIVGRDLDGSGEIGDVPEPRTDYRLIPYHGDATVDGKVPLPDFMEFVKGITNGRGHTKRQWVNRYTFQSGRPCDYQTWRDMVDVLEKHNIIEGKGRGTAGHLRIKDAGEIVRHLRLEGAL